MGLFHVESYFMTSTIKHLKISDKDWIRIDLHETSAGLAGCVTSSLQSFQLDYCALDGPPICCENESYRAATDALEAVVLSHACAGINVEDKAYVEGLNQAIAEIINRFG